MAAEADVDKENIWYIFENMSYGEDDRDFSLALEWIKEHPKIHCWINGQYWGLNSARSNYISGEAGHMEGFKCDTQILKGDPFAETAVNCAVAAQTRWININVDIRQEMLYKLSHVLESKRKLISQLCDMEDEDFDLIVDYFSFYSDITIDEYWESVGVVLIILSPETPAWVVAMHVAAALSADCSVIINPSSKGCFFSFLLAEICTESGLPKGLVNVIPGKEKTYEEFLNLDIQKIVYNGSLPADNSIGDIVPYLSVLVPHHTTSIILETCDVQGAVDKLFSETWENEHNTIWGIDTVVVQESIYHDFLSALTHKITNGPLNFSDNAKLRETLSKAVQKGAKVINTPNEDDTLVPIVISQHQLDFGEIPFMTLMTCRTADEAVKLVNNSRYCLGTSVWTENYAQALQVASQLDSSVVWINCHGIIDATISFEPTHKSGMGCFGGVEGALDHMTLKLLEKVTETEDNEKNQEDSPELENLCTIVQASVGRFAEWKIEKNRRKYLKDIVGSMIAENLQDYISCVNYWAHMGNSYELLKGCKRLDLYAVQNKKPIGVVVIVLMDSKNICQSFTSFVSPAIALGNAVILVIRKEHASELKILIGCFCKNLPHGVVTVVEGIGNAPALAADPNIHALSVYTEEDNMPPEIRKLKNISAKHFKRFWVQPNIERYKSAYAKNLLKEQTIFLPTMNNST